MKNYICYITTNILNGKKYIGSHVTLDINDSYMGSGVYLKKALKKYGKENFKREILAKVNNYNLMKELEEYYIEYYNAYSSNMFYNATKYSSGITKFPEEKKQLISKKNKNNKYHFGFSQTPHQKSQTSKANKGKKHTKEFKNNISERLKNNNFALGNKFSEESKLKISKAKINHICYKNSERGKKISKKLKGIPKSEEFKQKLKQPRPNKYKSIIQYDLEGNFIREWKSLQEISIYLNKNQTTRIIGVCQGKFKSAYNFKWGYKN